MVNTLARRNWIGEDGVVHKNDIYLDDDQQLAIVNGKECHAQVIEAVIKTLKGELQLDVDAGIPYFETIFNNSRSASDWAREVRTAVEDLDFVVSINSFTYSYDFYNAHLQYVLVVETDDGEVTITEG